MVTIAKHRTLMTPTRSAVTTVVGADNLKPKTAKKSPLKADAQKAEVALKTQN